MSVFKRPKPRLKRIDGIWMCWSGFLHGFGRSMADAYKDWERKVLL